MNPEKIIQRYENLKKYYPELMDEELQKIDELESLVKDGNKKHYFFFRKKEEIERKRMLIIERASDILFQLLREERAYEKRDYGLELSREFPPEVYLSQD